MPFIKRTRRSLPSQGRNIALKPSFYAHYSSALRRFLRNQGQQLIGFCIRYETYNDDGRVMLEASAGILIVDFREGQRQIRSRLAIKTLKTLLSVSFLTLTRWSRDWQPFWLAGKGWNRLMGIWQQMKAPKGWVEFLNWMLGNSGSCGWKLQNSCMYTGK